MATPSGASRRVGSSGNATRVLLLSATTATADTAANDQCSTMTVVSHVLRARNTMPSMTNAATNTFGGVVLAMSVERVKGKISMGIVSPATIRSGGTVSATIALATTGATMINAVSPAKNPATGSANAMDVRSQSGTAASATDVPREPSGPDAIASHAGVEKVAFTTSNVTRALRTNTSRTGSAATTGNKKPVYPVRFRDLVGLSIITSLYSLRTSHSFS